MSKAIAKLHLLSLDRRGVAAMEYGLIAAFVALIVVVGANSFGDSLSGFFTRLGNNFNGLGTVAP